MRMDSHPDTRGAWSINASIRTCITLQIADKHEQKTDMSLSLSSRWATIVAHG